MSKEESVILRGVAILLMLFLHLFNQANLADLCHPLLYCCGQPLVHILSRATNPVPFFIILSGYGLNIVYESGNLKTKKQLRRLAKLYVHYWLILLVFVSIGSFLRPERYPGSFWNVVGNLTGWRTSYNSEIWFLFPYAVLSLTAFPIFRLIDKLGNVKSLLLFLAVTLVSGYVTSRYIAVYKLYDSILAHVLTYLGFLFAFALGAVMARKAAQGNFRVPLLERHAWMAMCLLALLISFRCLFTTGAFHSVYVFFFILLFLHIPLSATVKWFLLKMGTHSMPIWMIHSFFCYHLFKPFIYGFQYPLVIYVVLLAISYVVSVPVMAVARFVIRRLKI